MNPLLQHSPHRRFNSLTGEWVFVSPQRTDRPWLGAVEPAQTEALPHYDPKCYLCPGNERANGEHNPNYGATYAFTNDYPAFLPDTQTAEISDNALMRAQTHAGTCRVLCFSPRHNASLAQLPVSQIRSVVQLWVEEVRQLSERWRWVQVFENKGVQMGASNAHPHGQIWASDFIPTHIESESLQQFAWHQRTGEPLLLSYGRLEYQARQRLVIESPHWLVVVPWWALWPYETLILPRREVRTLPELTPSECDDLSTLLKRLFAGFDELFHIPFPYSFGWHGAPRDTLGEIGWQLHAHIYPPLLRSATIRKFMVGYEMFAEGQRDLTPEQAAARLRQAVLP